MGSYFDATEDFLRRQNEIGILLENAEEEIDDEKRQLFLKLAVVLLVTKFQVYVEKILTEYIYVLQLNNVPYNRISTYMQLNSVKLTLRDNALINLSKHSKLNEDTKNKIGDYLKSISFIVEDNQTIDANFKFMTSFPLGRTGKEELLNLFKQVNGDDNIFIDHTTNEEIIDLNKLDSLLLTRHLIVHQDRFNQTKQTIEGYIDFLHQMVSFLDSYLCNHLKNSGIDVPEGG